MHFVLNSSGVSVSLGTTLVRNSLTPMCSNSMFGMNSSMASLRLVNSPLLTLSWAQSTTAW